MKILNQKYNRHSKSFEILEDGVWLIISTNSEYKVHFEDIGTEEFILDKKRFYYNNSFTFFLQCNFGCYIIFQEFRFQINIYY
jgi:hypothetical protein